MRIFFEEHQYQADDVKNDLKDICALQDVDKKISVSYVGYFYNTAVKDCVFILPKVLLTDKKINGETIEIVANVTGKENESVVTRADVVTPEDIITPEGQEKHLTEEYRKFIYEFAVWIYRALSVYRKQIPSSKAIYYRTLPQEGRGKRHKAKTYLDIILSLIKFNRENQNYFLFTIKNLHRGNNKINWTKTISKGECLQQGNEILYVNPVNKKRIINYEEELFIIFFSILNHINETYGFRCPINWQYDLITGQQFEAYIKGRGKIRLNQIKYKYFSDKALQLWDLCKAFFDSAHKLTLNTSQKEYLLAKSFEHVFEAMIDDLIGSTAPKGLKEQRDGKRVDHIYTYKGLTHSDEQDDEIFYIGDSKYYKIGHKLGRESIYKQYTYARNVIQWNIELFMDEHNGWSDEELHDHVDDFNMYRNIRLRNDKKDPLTEGYNVIPNFFLSAFIDKNRKYNAEENIIKHEHQSYPEHIQFKDRLFDRDTLILSHYDVNFLYVIYLYARNRIGEKATWRNEIRRRFRDEIRQVLDDKYHFIALKSKVDPLVSERYIRENYKELQGKLYRPYKDKNIFVLALEKKDNKDPKDSSAYQLLSGFFEFEQVKLIDGKNPEEALNERVKKFQEAHPYSTLPAKNGVLMVMMEKYGTRSVNFLNSGKLAVGLKLTYDSMNIVKRLDSIGYVLFHVWKDEEQHMFRINDNCVLKSVDDIDSSIYKNIEKDITMFVVLDIDATQELDVSKIHAKNKSGKGENDVQYATIEELY